MSSLPELEARIVTLEHISAIKEVQHRYWHGVDQRNFDMVRECFLDGGVTIDMEGVPVCNSVDDFIKVLQANGNPGFLSLHTGHNEFVHMTGAVQAEGQWDAFFTAVDVGQRLTYQLTGQYTNQYVVRNGRWFIKVQKFRQRSLLIKKIAEDGSEQVVTFGAPDPKVFDK
jgi:hypothetical protein